MTSNEAKDLIIKHTKHFMELNGFTLLKTKNSNARFKREYVGGYDIVGFSCTDYNPTQMVGYGVNKKIYAVENITQEINKVITLSPPVSANTVTVAFSEETLHGYRTPTKEEVEFMYANTEDDIKRNIDKIISFLCDEAFPLLEKFNDIREIDKVINNPEDFWVDDWQTPFNLGGNYIVKRLIISKLCGRFNFEHIVEKSYTGLDELLMKQGVKGKANRNPSESSLPFTVQYLQSIPPLTFPPTVVTTPPRPQLLSKEIPHQNILSALKQKLFHSKSTPQTNIQFTPTYSTPFDPAYTLIQDKTNYYEVEDILYRIFDGEEVAIVELVYTLRYIKDDKVRMDIICKGLLGMMKDDNANFSVLIPTFTLQSDSTYVVSHDDNHTTFSSAEEWNTFYAHLLPVIDPSHTLHTIAWNYYDVQGEAGMSISSKRYIGDE